MDLADHVPQVAFLSELLFYYFENTVKSKRTKKKRKKKEKDQQSGDEHSGSQQENPEQLCNPGFSLSAWRAELTPAFVPPVIPVLVPFRALASSSAGEGVEFPQGRRKSIRWRPRRSQRTRTRKSVPSTLARTGEAPPSRRFNLLFPPLRHDVTGGISPTKLDAPFLIQICLIVVSRQSGTPPPSLPGCSICAYT